MLITVEKSCCLNKRNYDSRPPPQVLLTGKLWHEIHTFIWEMCPRKSFETWKKAQIVFGLSFFYKRINLFLLEDNYFTILWFLPYISVNR